MIRSIVNLCVLAAIIGAAYYLWNWKSGSGSVDEARQYAERACVDAAGHRYDATAIRPYSVEENSNGYVVRVSMTLTRGTRARVTCLTSANGRVEEIILDE